MPNSNHPSHDLHLTLPHLAKEQTAEFLTPKQAAGYLRVSKSYLDKLRVYGGAQISCALVARFSTGNQSSTIGRLSAHLVQQASIEKPSNNGNKYTTTQGHKNWIRK
jgi:hypothetical protein